jgi:hypothetical protein
MSPEEAAAVKIPDFKTPRKDRNGSRYARYIITKPKSHVPKNAKKRPEPPRRAKTTQIVSLDSTISPGAFYADFVWIWSGDLTMAPKTHSHDFDEMIGFVSYNGRENPRAIVGDISMKIGKDQYGITKSSLVYVPGGVDHCPIEFKDIQQPVLLFTIGNAKQWSQQKP